MSGQVRVYGRAKRAPQLFARAQSGFNCASPPSRRARIRPYKRRGDVTGRAREAPTRRQVDHFFKQIYIEHPLLMLTTIKIPF